MNEGCLTQAVARYDPTVSFHVHLEPQPGRKAFVSLPVLLVKRLLLLLLCSFKEKRHEPRRLSVVFLVPPLLQRLQPKPTVPG
jgi:hypothetical protein